MNKETLEEAKIRIRRANYVTANDGDIFEMGVKWQAERMYSEEEVRRISLDFFYHWYNAKGSNTEQGFDKWFEQFKKK